MLWSQLHRDWPKFAFGAALFSAGFAVMPEPHGWLEWLGIMMALAGFSIARESK